LWRRPDVDATAGQTALATYQELLGRYPGTDAAARAQMRIRQLNEWFSEKSYKTGMFYLRRRAYDSAIIYFKEIVASYPDTRLVPDALLRLVDTYKAIGYAEERKETCANLRRYYPQASGIGSRCPAETSAGAP
jgi:outer membrane protein assembly factor BamD